MATALGATGLTAAVKFSSAWSRVGDLPRELVIPGGGHVARDLDRDPHGIVDRWRTVDDDLELAGDPRGELHEDRLDREREDVDALDDEHLVRPAEDPEPKAGPPAVAWLGEDLHQVVRAHPQERACLAPDRGVDHLALLTVRERQDGAVVGIDQLGDRETGATEVDAISLVAFAGVEAELAGPVLVAGDHPPGLLDPLAIAGYLQAGLAREIAPAKPHRSRLDPESCGHLGKPDGVRRRRPDADRIRDAGHHREQPLAVTDTERDGRRAERLEGQVVAEAARVEVVVHALEDDLARPTAHRPQGPCAHLAVVGDVAPGQPDPHRLAGRPAGRLDPDDLVQRRALVDAEERPARLRLGDLRLLHERDPLEVLAMPDIGRPDAGCVEPVAIERAGRVVVGDLLGEAVVLETSHIGRRHRLDRLVPERRRHDPSDSRPSPGRCRR